MYVGLLAVRPGKTRSTVAPGGQVVENVPMDNDDILRVATYNIHKGVQGIGPARRLEIHNLGLAVEQLDADIVCLQEVRGLHRREAAYFQRWPDVPQAEFLAPEGYEAVYRTNAFTKHGEHGNALLTRWPVIGHQHEDMSDHRFEQRGLLHVPVQWNGSRAAACARLRSCSASSSARFPRARRWWSLAISTIGACRSSACWRVLACMSTTMPAPSPTRPGCRWRSLTMFMCAA